jgi:aromatic ring hydroxylase
MPKTGSQHAQSLNDGRQVFINGQPVANVGEHPRFAGQRRRSAACSTLRLGRKTLI